MECDWGLGADYVDPIYESMVSQEIYEDQYEQAQEYFKARNVDITSEFLERIDEYSLRYEVLTSAYSQCLKLERDQERDLSPEEVCVELNCAALDWDV